MVVSARGSVLFHLASHVCFAYLEIMVGSLSWSAKRKASGRPRGTSGKLSKEQRLQKRARGGQGVVIGVSESSLRDWRSATGQSGGISRRMMKMETLGTQVIENHGAGTDWPVVGMAGSSFEHCAGWMFAGVGGVSAPEDFSVEWYNFSWSEGWQFEVDDEGGEAGETTVTGPRSCGYSGGDCVGSAAGSVP